MIGRNEAGRPWTSGFFTSHEPRRLEGPLPSGRRISGSAYRAMTIARAAQFYRRWFDFLYWSKSLCVGALPVCGLIKPLLSFVATSLMPCGGRALEV